MEMQIPRAIPGFVLTYVNWTLCCEPVIKHLQKDTKECTWDLWSCMCSNNKGIEPFRKIPTVMNLETTPIHSTIDNKIVLLQGNQCIVPVKSLRALHAWKVPLKSVAYQYFYTCTPVFSSTMAHYMCMGRTIQMLMTTTQIVEAEIES